MDKIKNDYPFQLLTISEVEQITNISRNTIYVYIKKNLFPKPIRIANTRVRWVGEEINKWYENLKETRNAQNHKETKTNG